MLRKFTVRNYKSFKDPITLDFTKYNDYQFNTDVIHDGLLTKAIIIGPNASGKTNFGLAIFDITLHLIDKYNHFMQDINYINADGTNDEAEFTYEFQFDQKIVIYKYQKRQSRQLKTEQLTIDDELIYSYNYENKRRDFRAMGLIGAESLNLPTKAIDISILRYIASNTVLGSDSPVNQIMDFVSRMLWFRSIENFSFIGYSSVIESIIENILSNGLVEKFEAFLKEAGIEQKLLVKTNPSGGKVLYTKCSNQPIPFWETASSGTKAMTLFFFWSQQFAKVSFLFIDEFDAFYHFELAEAILKQIISNKTLQCVVTAYRTSIISNNILRPDAYFLLENGKLTSLSDRSERIIREGHNLEKMYRQGDF
jgi:AAA15 family ATPase/GTPase